MRQMTKLIEGQAVLEGVMMRSPNTVVVAMRSADGSIKQKLDHWPASLPKDWMEKPFLRGIFIFFESIAAGFMSLNYIAEVEPKEESTKKNNLSLYLMLAVSLFLGLILFIFLPRFVAAGFDRALGLNLNPQGLALNLIQGGLKTLAFLFYLFCLGFIPSMKRAFEYHGAQYKILSTLKSKKELNQENIKDASRFHFFSSSSFVLYVFLISILIFSVMFSLFPLGKELPLILKSIVDVAFKISFLFPIAGITYELIEFAKSRPDNYFCRLINDFGMKLQKLTSREPSDEQLEVALVCIKAVLEKEEKIIKKRIIRV